MPSPRILHGALLVGLAGALAGCNSIAGWDDLPAGGAPKDTAAASVNAPPAAQASDSAHSTASAAPTSVTLPAVSGEHTCALTGANGDVKCWGRNVIGQLGAGDTSPHLTPASVTKMHDVTSLATGLLHSCAVVAGGEVYCWGSNRYAALGRGTKDELAHPAPELIASLRATRVHCGMNFTCAETAERTVACWGTNDMGQLGDGTTLDTNLPQPITSIDDVDSVSTGSRHACAVVIDAFDDREVYCWGYNDHGQLGQKTGLVSSPRRIPGLTGVREVVTGDSHTCAILEGGDVKCWGANDQGQLGVARSADVETPTSVPGLARVKALALGAQHTCAQVDAQLYCWGSNAHGQLGVDPATVPQQTAPLLVRAEGVLETIGIAGARGDQTCAVRLDGVLFCWGANEEGQLGNGTTDASSSPSRVLF
jgi:alpha-tubulin suppressor-like RCC1 family protein